MNVACIFRLCHHRKIFDLFCLLNRFGYDSETDPRGFSPVRQFMRKQLFSTVREDKELRAFVNKLFTDWPWIYLLQMVVLKISHPPEETLISRIRETVDQLRSYLPIEVSSERLDWIEQTLLMLNRFSNICPTTRLWKTYLKESQIPQSAQHTGIRALMKATKLFTPLKLLSIEVIVNDLQPFHMANQFRINDCIVIVMGSLKKRYSRVIQHEILHLLVEHIVENVELNYKELGSLFQPLKRDLIASGYWAIDDHYGIRRAIIEHFVRSLVIFLNPTPTSRERNIQWDEAQGFRYIRILVSFWEQKLKQHGFDSKLASAAIKMLFRKSKIKV